MNKKHLLWMLPLVGAIGGGAGFFAGKAVYQVDRGFIEEQKKQNERLKNLDAALEDSVDQPAVAGAVEGGAAKDEAAGGEGQAPKGEAAKKEEPTKEEPKTAEPEAKPPEGWKPRKVSFGVQSKGMSRATFTSDAPLETIVGNTSKVSGTIAVDLADPTKSTGKVSVDLATLRTGIDLRDEHLRGENWLDTGNHPQATFELKEVKGQPGQLFPGRKLAVRVVGDLTIKGQTKEITAALEVRYFEKSDKFEQFGIQGDVMRIQAAFAVKLSDFGISAPQLVGKKVSEEVTLALNLTAVEQKEAAGEATTK